ncbi:MAG: hypothetical protein HRT88_23335 [Lentisphaeraceae bacterium]|nr:hypothetical protein [Lentisphaeraceae bacterium]
MNKKKINVALATSKGGEYGINHLSRIIRRNNMSVRSPIFPLGANKGLAADISANDLIALVNRHSIYLYDSKGRAKGSVLPRIKLDRRIPRNSQVWLRVSPDNKFLAVAYTHSSVDKKYGQFNTILNIYSVEGKMIKETKLRDLSDVKFSKTSNNLYFTNGHRLVCYTQTKAKWTEDLQLSWYAESGNILSFAISEDGTKVAYSTSNGHNKVASVKFGVTILSCVMTETDTLRVTR